MNSEVVKYAIIENIITVIACVVCVVGLAAFTDGYWGWGFAILLNTNQFKSTPKGGSDAKPTKS